MFLNEVVKSFIKKPEQKPEDDSSLVNHHNVIADLSNADQYPTSGSFFDDEQFFNGLYGTGKTSEVVFRQKEKIMKYRQLAMMPDVSDAIDEIVNEIIFSYDDNIPIKVNVDDDNEKLVKAISNNFNKILSLTDIKRKLYHIVKRAYVDGQIILHCAYDKQNTKNGIKSIKMIDPCMLYFDKWKNVYKYMNDERATKFYNSAQFDYSIEEIVREDFGLYDDSVVLGYLEYAIKPANMLKTLEDLLVPLRFSRSISRRVFNVDIGDLPAKRGAEVMREHQSKFKYKKFYNNETGEVSNQQHITSMVEDYWFANRSGGKGTTVDVLDESGNLGELGDILYFAKKLYRAMKIPSNRISIDSDGDKDFSFDTTTVSKEDIKFFMFISRLRQVFSSLFKEILKRECISTKTMSEDEWAMKENSIRIVFAEENKFIENMKLKIFQEQLDIYSSSQDFASNLFTKADIINRIFRLSKEETEENLKNIEVEKKNPLYKALYTSEEF